MPQRLAWIVATKTQIPGMKSKVSDIKLGNETLRTRLKRQLSSLKVKAQLISEDEFNFETDSDVNDLSRNPVFFDHCVYSDSLVNKIIKQNWLYDRTNQSTIQTQFNVSFSHDHPKIQTTALKLKAPQSWVEQKILYKIVIRLPRAVYPESNYFIPVPDVFFQKISDWPDLLKAQGLLARESLGRLSARLLPWVGSKILDRIVNHPWLSTKANQIGKNCRIHPTAILESCVIGDNVEIGPYSYLRASIIGDNVTIREQSSIKLSHIGSGSFLVPCDMFNCLIGQSTFITTSILYNSVIGDGTFIGGGVGFADLNSDRASVNYQTDQGSVASDQMFLGSLVAENCFIGAGLMFQSGQRIPHSSTVLNYELSSSVGIKSNGLYMVKGQEKFRIPKQFLKSASKSSCEGLLNEERYIETIESPNIQV